VKSIDVFCGIDCFDYFGFIQTLRQRELDEYPIHVCAPVERFNEVSQLAGRGRCGQCVVLRLDTNLFASPHLISNVNSRSGIVAHSNRSQAWLHSMFSRQPSDFQRHFAFDLIGDNGSIEQFCASRGLLCVY
jgi:hypothetical protein